MNLIAENFRGGCIAEETNILSYDDFDKIAECAIGAIQYASGAGIMKGKSKRTINPKDPATRAEAAVMVNRVYENYQKQQLALKAAEEE